MTTTDEIYSQLELFLTEDKRDKKIWRIKCKWDNSVIRDIIIHCNADDLDGAKKALYKCINKSVEGKHKGRTHLDEKIIEFYLLVK
jgi:hypothetical protein